MVRPFLADQPFWAARVHRLGLGPAPLTGRLTPDKLADAISAAVRTPGHRRQAEATGAEVRAEDGVAAAVRRLAKFGNEPGTRPG